MGVFMEKENRKQIVNRFKRIEGQIRGVAKLVENEAPCLDILTQVSAITGAVKKAGTEVIRVYLDQCLTEACTKPEADRDGKKKEFQKALARYIDMA
jgi:DNA-binding FrmR family transcriptional regulator